MRNRNFNNSRDSLSLLDKLQIFDLLSSGLRQKNRNLLETRLFKHLSMIPMHGCLERIMCESNGKWSYCAGQDYPSEIRNIRKIILECK